MNSPVDRATPRIVQPKAVEKMVDEGNVVIAKMKSSPNLGSAPDVAAKLGDFDAANAALAANNKKRADAEAALEEARTQTPMLVRRWGTRRRAVESAVETFADGSKDIVLSFTDLEVKQPSPEATVPTNLRPVKTRKPGDASARWNPTPGAHGYMVQHCTNPNDASTFSQAIATSEARFRLSGLPAGTIVYFRVLAQDKTLPEGQTAYTAWVLVVVL